MSVRFRENRSSERGQVLAIVAGGMITLIVFVGLVIDTGVAFRERRIAQNVSDLAAIAGLRILAANYLDPVANETGTDVYNAIDASARFNGCADPCTWTAQYVKPDGTGTWSELDDVVDSGAIPLGAQGVRVTTDRHPGTFFVRVLGMNEWEVSTEATAMTSQLGSPPSGVLMPIAMFDADYEAGQEYTLTNGYEGPGNFGWLSWLGSTSEQVLGDSICHPDNPTFEFPHWFDGSTGTKNASDIRRCIDEYIANQTVVYVPLWRQTNDGGGSKLQYEITGIAAMILTSYDQHAVEVRGRFLAFYSYPGVPAGFGAPPCSATTNPDCNERTNFFGLVN
jgi:hypothetical protein